MEGLLCIAGIIFIILLAVFSNSAGSQNASRADAGGSADLQLKPFEVSLVQTEATFGNTQVDVFKVRMRGLLGVPSNNCDCQLNVQLLDRVQGSKEIRPILCAIDALTNGKVPVLNHSQNFSVPYSISVIHDWIDILSIPIETLTFPTRGQRIITCAVRIVANQTTTSVAHASYDYAFFNPNVGYLDARENHKRWQEKTVALAMAMSCADGDPHPKEAAVIKRWIQSRVEVAPEAERFSTKERLNETVQATLGKAEAGGININSVCEEITKVATTSERYETLDLCLQIIKADETAQESEMRLLEQIAGFLELDSERFRAMLQKAIPLDMHEVKDTQSLLGITEGMNHEEMRKQLNNEYRKWNGRVSHPDPAIRKQAEEMLQLIAETRKSHFG